MKRLMYMCGCYHKAKLAEPDFFFWKILKLLLNFLDALEDILIISFVGILHNKLQSERILI
jgi:hypothetical protein